MQALKIPKKAELMRWGSVALGVIFLLVAAKGCHHAFSSLGKKKDFLNKQIMQGEVLIAHTAALDTERLRRERQELDARLETTVQVSNVLEELNHLGEEQGVSFKSVEPVGAEEEAYLGIRMEVEGSFEALGKFLGALDKLNTAVARVKSIDLKGQGPATPPYMSLEVELYRHQVQGS